MSTLVPPERRLIYQSGAQYRSAVSEELIQRLGALANFISLFQYDTKAFFLNGKYSVVSTPQSAVDGLYRFPFNAEIFDVVMFSMIAGSSGTTILDVKRVTQSGGVGVSIFTTTPKIASTAGNNSYIGIGETGTGLTAPVLDSETDVYNIDAGDAIYCDLLQSQQGDARNCGIIVYFRPR